MSPRNTESTGRADAAIRWVGWHLVELAGVGVPLVLAATNSTWWLMVAALSGSAWGAHEWRLARHHTALLPGAQRSVTANPTSGDPDDQDNPAQDPTTEKEVSA